MFDWIPLQSYSNLYNYILLLILIIIMFSAFAYDVRDEKNLAVINVIGWVFTIIIILYIGLRPIDGVFVDMKTYAKAYYRLQSGAAVRIDKDIVFNYFMKWCSTWMSASSFFFVLANLYIIPCIIFSKKYFGQYWFFGVFVFVSSFTFWNYGVNGMRNGTAAAFFILGCCFYERKLLMLPMFFLAYFIHASLIIPIAAFIVASLYKNPKVYVYIWLISIPLSLLGGSAWLSFFTNIGIVENRLDGYLVDNEQYMHKFSKTGFRWDFLIYSSTAVFAGWYFIFKKKIVDTFYVHIFGVYCIANAFWILVITAAFSNRFAYPSWILMPIIISYPMFRYKIWKDQYKIFAIILLAYFMFTFVMNIK